MGVFSMRGGESGIYINLTKGGVLMNILNVIFDFVAKLTILPVDKLSLILFFIVVVVQLIKDR
jgi:hypothetical protein